MKGKWIQIRATAEEHEMFRRHAAERGMNISEYVFTIDKEASHGLSISDNRGSWVVRCLNKIRRI